jgi:FkbM family methyltransferase
VCIIGRLWDGHEVRLCPETFEWGGSWSGATTKRPIAYDPWLLKFAYQILMKMDHPFLVDVGASTGSFSLLPKFVPGMHCLAFEPRTYEILRRNIALNNLQGRVTIRPYAVSDHALGASLWHAPDNKLSGCATLREVKGWNHISVKTVTLDAAGPESATLVKIDVEGLEHTVLVGGETFLRRVAPALIVEYKHSGLSATAGFLTNLGYRYVILENHRDFYAWRLDGHSPEGIDAT